MCDVCVIGVYIPHRFRKRAPFQQDTLEQLRLFADSLPPSMCRVILGDFNCKIGRKETGQICGAYSMHEESCIGGLQLGDLMREQDLVATSTMFRPRKSLALGSATYINNRKVQKATQIDYIMITGRWKSAVQSSYGRWGPSIHIFGWRYDYEMLCTKLKFKVKSRSRTEVEKERQTNWEELRLEGMRNEFEAAYQRAHAKMLQRRAAEGAEVIPLSCEQRMEDLTNTINEAKLALGTKEYRGKRGRTRSERTEKLHGDREAALSSLVRGSAEWRTAKALYRNQINHSCRRDWREHVEGIITDIEKANEAGNSRAVWEAVKYLGGSSKRPAPKQPSKSPAGEEIRSSEELAEAWRAFCADTKFACTEAESRRPDYEDIGDASERENDVPTMEELELCLKALKAGRACGPDQIPVEAYRGSESAKNDLFEFIKQCWREERLPTTLGKGTFGKTTMGTTG